MKKDEKIILKVTSKDNIHELSKLSTENLILYIIGMSEINNINLNVEEITLECWLINSKKHSLRGYPQFPDSFTVMKRIYDMKGRKGLLIGSSTSGFKLTLLSKNKFNKILLLLKDKRIPKLSSIKAADRNISSIDEAPYKRLIKTSAYVKYTNNQKEQIVESDYLYFYNISWHNKKTQNEGKIKNIDMVIDNFSIKNPLLNEVKEYLNNKFLLTKKQLTK